jgi:hypothetical protein
MASLIFLNGVEALFMSPEGDEVDNAAISRLMTRLMVNGIGSWRHAPAQPLDDARAPQGEGDGSTHAV